MEDHTMKPMKLLLPIFLCLFNSAFLFSQDDFYPSSNFDNGADEEYLLEDNYSTASDYYREQNGSQAAINNIAPSDSESFSDGDGNVNITNNYYGDNFNASDDYYDYAYASRIRRFHRNNGRFGYYNDWYTNYYWYDYNPFNFGTSVYVSYGWWNPSPWNVNFGWSNFGGWPVNNCWNWGYAGPNFYWNNYPYHRYGSYWRGYNHGFRDGFAANYYNSFDRNSYYYGHRKMNTSYAGYDNRRVSTTSNNKTFGQKYERAFANQRTTASRPSAARHQSTTIHHTAAPSRTPGIDVRTPGKSTTTRSTVAGSRSSGIKPMPTGATRTRTTVVRKPSKSTPVPARNYNGTTTRKNTPRSARPSSNNSIKATRTVSKPSSNQPKRSNYSKPNVNRSYSKPSSTGRSTRMGSAPSMKRSSGSTMQRRR